jgi:5-methyltetrahydrofolate--homocysteine methyltransferase
MKLDFLEQLRSQTVLADGAMGTQLQLRGLEPGVIGEVWNVDYPDRVESVHRAYCDAGARYLTTNSFQGNPLTLVQHGLAGRARELNCAAASVASRIASSHAWVFGSMGPFGGFVEPLGETPADELSAAFEEQARSLLEGGADGIVVETMSALEEAVIAVRAARKAGAPVVVAMMTFGKGPAGFRTMTGVGPEKAATSLEAAGADVVGTNCGVDLSLDDYEAIVRAMVGATARPVIVRPNAGKPTLVGSGVRYLQEPAMMAAEIGRLARAGARIVGGCCGTSPEHIALFRHALEGV